MAARKDIALGRSGHAILMFRGQKVLLDSNLAAFSHVARRRRCGTCATPIARTGSILNFS